MSRTFEEMASRELDSLYQGALFLSGGEPRVAERLLVDTMTSSFREHARGSAGDSIQPWLEARLVQQFLGGVDQGPAPLRRPGDRSLHVAFEELGADTLFAAAASLPFWPRAAVWLVLLRRWSYADACDALNVDRDVLDDLLRYRDVLMTEVLRASRRQTGTDGARM